MSTENAQRFLKELQSNEALRIRVEAIKGANLLAQLVALANGEGFQFSAEEYREAVMLESEGELSEESLGQVLEELGLEKREKNDRR